MVGRVCTTKPSILVSASRETQDLGCTVDISFPWVRAQRRTPYSTHLLMENWFWMSPLFRFSANLECSDLQPPLTGRSRSSSRHCSGRFTGLENPECNSDRNMRFSRWQEPSNLH